MTRYIKANAVTVPQLNTELAKIETAIQDTLSRKGDTPNAMEGTLDMNSNRVINVPDAVNAQEPLTLGQYLLSKEESAALKDAVFVDSIKDLASINTVTNNNVFVRGFYTGTDVGGGLFYWDSTKDKTEHNGGTVLDPARITAWDGTQSDLSTLFTSAASGAGCFVRQFGLPTASPEGCASWFGAVFDGVTDDQPAIQKAYSVFKWLNFPEATIYLGSPVSLGLDAGEFNAYNLQGGYTVNGASKTKTKFIRDGLEVESPTELTYTTQACFNVHGMYNTISNVAISSSGIGIFLGQNINQVGNTFVSRTKISSVVVENCGTGICYSVENGCTYNELSDAHIYECQIGIHARNGRWVGPSYFNRNNFYNTRVSRCWVGVWIKNSDTNRYYSLDFEGITNSPEISSIPQPSGLPPITPNINNAIALLFEECTFHRYFGGTFETCDTRIIDYQASATSNSNQYIGLLAGENVSNPDRFAFSNRPAVWITDRSFINQFSSFGQSAYPNIDPDMGSGNPRIKGNETNDNGHRTLSKSYDLTPTSVAGNGVREITQNKGEFLASATLNHSFPADQTGVNSFTSFEVIFSGVDTVGRIGFSYKCLVVVAYSNINNSALRVRLDNTMLNGFTPGGGVMTDNTNTNFITASAAIAGGVVTLTFSNLTATNYEETSVYVKSVKVHKGA